MGVQVQSTRIPMYTTTYMSAVRRAVEITIYHMSPPSNLAVVHGSFTPICYFLVPIATYIDATTSCHDSCDAFAKMSPSLPLIGNSWSEIAFRTVKEAPFILHRL
jgi:hypothetical protein